MYIMKMSPAFKDYLWGGERLVEQYGKAAAVRPVAESWEISCYPDCPSVIANGSLKGTTLPDALAANPALKGKNTGDFPVLVKLIDARQRLSIQVHPDDDYAGRFENESGKNEMWYVVDCEPDSELIMGFKEPVTKHTLENAIRGGTLLSLVNHVKVRPGDCFSIPAGLIHSIGEGCLIAEIQQSSNVTYRVYDYDRTGADGKPRELHIEKAVDVIDVNLRAGNNSHAKPQEFDGYTMTKLTRWSYFSACLLDICGQADLTQDRDRFSCLLVTDGALTAVCSGESATGESRLDLKAGESAFIPAGLGAYTLKGKAKAIITTV